MISLLNRINSTCSDIWDYVFGCDHAEVPNKPRKPSKPRDTTKLSEVQKAHVIALFAASIDTQENLTKLLNEEFGCNKSRSAYAHMYQASRRI